jgi:hypothetical protein
MKYLLLPLLLPLLGCPSRHPPVIPAEVFVAQKPPEVSIPLPPKDLSRPPLSMRPAQPRPAVLPARLALSFDPGSKSLTDAQKASLAAFRGRVVEVTGTADSMPWRGVSGAESKALNRRIAQARASVCRYWLHQAGAEKVTVKWVSPAPGRECRVEAK